MTETSAPSPSDPSTGAEPSPPGPGVEINVADRSDEGLALIGVLVTDAGRRLRTFSAIGMGIFAAGVPLSTVVAKALGQPEAERDVLSVLCVVLFGVSLGVHLFARKVRARPATMVLVGLLYVGAASAAMAAAETLLTAPDQPDWRGISGICVWLVLFPLIIPCTPRQALWTALASAVSLPLFLGVSLALGGPRLPIAVLGNWWAPVFFCAGLSFVAALSVHRLSAALAEARAAVRKAGRYELVELVGQGGMGQVWRARHGVLPQDMAVKLIRPAAGPKADPEHAREVARRFRREAQAVSLLRSPNTVRLFDYGVSEDGELFAVMEFLRGYDLGRLVETLGPQPPGRVVHILAQVCSSLSEAHAVGLVHRDVKPANLMLCRLGTTSDVVKVLDFGLVGAMEHGPVDLDDAGTDGESRVVGTPGYVAPEVLLGGTADARSDLFAVGVVGYWLLTGTTLFPREGGGEDISRHFNDEPESPATRLGRALPEALCDLVLRAVSRDPDRRPASAAALRDELYGLDGVDAWTEGMADRWWEEYPPGDAPPRGADGRSTPPVRPGSLHAVPVSESIPPTQL